MNQNIKIIKKLSVGFVLLMLFACGQNTEEALAEYPQIYLDPTSRIIGQLAENGKTESFLGVPFAKPPIGELRWAPPKEMLILKGKFHASDFAPACMQADRITKWYKNVVRGFGGNPEVIKAPAISEDCLYLNIWRPKTLGVSDQALPVVVYIHGGSNKAGWSYEPNYIGSNMAEEGVIVISIAYRLGVFGYFSHPEFDHSNFGLLDMVEALRWINRNIEAIGGDSERITLMGESAGAGNIDYLMAIPSSEGLFSRAIHQSSGSAIFNLSTKEDHSTLGVELEKTLLVDQTENISDRLIKLPADRILTAAEQVYEGHYFDNAVDGKSVFEPLMETIKNKKLHTVELLIGSNQHESLMYLDENLSSEDWLETQVSPKSKINFLPLLDQLASDRDKLNLLTTAQSFTCPALRLAKEFSMMGGSSWVYYFTRQRQGEMAASMGAYHGAELPYVFDTHDDWLPTAGADRKLTSIMQDYWISFIKNGNPNRNDMTNWPTYNLESSQIMMLGDNVLASFHPSQIICELLDPS